MILQVLYNLTIIASIGGFAACSCLVLYRAAQWVERQGVKPAVKAKDLMHPLIPPAYTTRPPRPSCNNCGTILPDADVVGLGHEECPKCGTVPAPKDVRTRRFTSFSGAKAKAENQALNEAKQ